MKYVLKLLITGVILVSNLNAQKKEIPDYSNTPRSEVPKEFTWKIEDIYANDQAFQKDFDEVKSMVQEIDVKSKEWTSSASKMLSFLNYSYSIMQKASKLYSYSSHQSDMDMSNSKFQVMKGEVQALYVQAGTKLSFMENDILTVKPETFKKYLTQEPKLSEYKFYVENTHRLGKHILSKEQEEIMSMTGLMTPAVSEASQLLNDVDMPAPEVTLSDGSKTKLNWANFVLLRASKNDKDRSIVMNEFWNHHKQFENTFAALLDGEMKSHLFNSRARKYSNTLEASLYHNNIDTEVYTNLIKYVKQNLNPLHRFLTLKKELLGLKVFKYDDIYASAVKSIDQKYTYDEAKNLLLNSLKPLGSEYVAALKTGLENRWVDIYPNKDKQSGAYSGGAYGVHPFVKMNYNGEYDAVSTLAHEFGHAIHSYLAEKYQPYPTSDYTLFLAEIASTFNENLLIDYMLKGDANDELKLFLIDNYLDQARGTIYRQTLFAEFELEMHKRVEEGKTLTADWLNDLYLKLTREYYGHDKGVTQVDEYIKNEWSNIPHFYYNYYVYQYSTGMIASMAFSQKVIAGGEKEVNNYLNVLKAGGSDYPINILKSANLDMTKAEPYTQGFKRFDDLVNEMEKIAARLKK